MEKQGARRTDLVSRGRPICSFGMFPGPIRANIQMLQHKSVAGCYFYIIEAFASVGRASIESTT